ncbi:hypothetical protein CAC42_5130 [Sphaceloma murrayae]|uniref:C3H1-type domain-containing protein n=1 Tax=Sphaceloma murrayae TaxID=2082308 RepID=A0A2K1QU78_9PEZI|nr:hypothetical protein CAC42_5130 [Sphaceloma murrayae]
MDEDAELQARIAALEGLRQHKSRYPLTLTDEDGKARIEREKKGSARYDGSPTSRWTPYGHAPAFQQTRGGHRGGYRGVSKPGFRNRTLVMNNGTPNMAEKSRTTTPEPADKASAGITTHDRGHMQWTNAAVYEEKAKEKVHAIQETTKAKRKAKDDNQKNKVVQHVYGSQTPTSNATPNTTREIIVNDLRFRVATDGSKLIRVFDGPNPDPHSTPKEARVAGVTFKRTKNGNMLRQGLLKNKRVDAGRIQKRLCADFTSTGTRLFQLPHATAPERSIAEAAAATTAAEHGLFVARDAEGALLTPSIGSCAHGNRCRFKHDFDKVAICKDFLRQRECAAGKECNLSHDLTPNRVPTCLHFLRNNCTKPDCPYSHASVDASAPVCKDFARLGYCEKGATCTDRHVSECPDYTNTGVCRNKKCRLPHIDRAATLRKAAAAKSEDDEMSFDVSSEEEDYEEIDSDDADSDEIEEDMVMAGAGSGHELSQQQDFISFK